MKKNIHPQTREVLFMDQNAGFSYVAESTVKTEKTVKHEDGKEYPVFYMDVSSASHPFYTGEQKILKTGAVDRFYARQKKTQEIQK